MAPIFICINDGRKSNKNLQVSIYKVEKKFNGTFYRFCMRWGYIFVYPTSILVILIPNESDIDFRTYIISMYHIHISILAPLGRILHIACQCLPSRRICVPSWKYKWRRLWSHFCLYWNWWTIIQMYGKHKKNTWVSLNLAFVFRRRTEYYNFCESNVSFHHHKRHCKVLGHLAISKKLKVWKRRSQVEKKLIWTLPRAYCFPNDGLIIEGKPFFIC